ncbi:uncharacterized protein LOC112554763 isoform X5 [Pomacea canaliculata]|nr:uncharacterized protein LOC112554763 isoform X5 [Pomacea canaliculata]
MLHEDPVSSDQHPLAARPFLCPWLLLDQDVMLLYSRIEKFAWPQSPQDARVELLEDGSRRIMSCDELASIVLSPHGQDFTVCYLSCISEDCRKDKHLSPADEHQFQGNRRGICEDISKTSCAELLSQKLTRNTDECTSVTSENKHERPEGIIKDSCLTANKNSLVSTSGSTQPYNQHNDKLNSKVQCDAAKECCLIDCEGKSKATASVDVQDHEISGIIVSFGKVSTPDTNRTHKLTGETDETDAVLPKLSVSPINQDISSISRISSPDGLRGLIDSDLALSQTDETMTECLQETSTSVCHCTDVLHSSPLGFASIPAYTNQDKTACTIETALNNSSCMKRTLFSPDGDEVPCFDNTNNNKIITEKSNVTDREHGPHSPQSCKPACEEACHVKPVERVSKRSSESDLCGSFHVHMPSSVEDKSRSPVYPPNERGSAALTAMKSPWERQKDSSHRHEPVGFTSRDDGPGLVQGDLTSAAKHQYMWVTQHLSCSDCPPAWRHPLKLLQQKDPCDLLASTGIPINTTATQYSYMQTRKMTQTEGYIFTAVPPPLPLNCPFQHLHTWQSLTDSEESGAKTSFSEFKQARLKIIMMEGVVYRFIHSASMKTVEVYPGDGSVFVSQGITAHFFLHLLWKDGKLEEKTYSIKALPPQTPKSPYSIEKIIKRAHRFLTGCIENSKLSKIEDLACWKHVPVHVVEPLPLSILEECLVPGFGRFTAFTNGRIRVIFEDRTALDMVSDFSNRLHGCMQHSDSFGRETSDVYSQGLTAEKLSSLRVSGLDQMLRPHQSRLLLPCGKYIMVEVDKPGIYQRYVNAAMEWITWVQSSPEERRQFYHKRHNTISAQLSAKMELKKIECFNYIVDHSHITNSRFLRSSEHPSSFPEQSAPVCTHNWCLHCVGHPTGKVLTIPPMLCPAGAESVQRQISHHQSPPYSQPCGQVTGNQVKNEMDVQTTSHRQLSGAGQHVFTGYNIFLADSKGQELLLGFNSVKDALLKTSQMIKDIDEIVEQRKKSS